MIDIANISISDSGWVSTSLTLSSQRLSTANMANSGAPIELKGVQFAPEISANIDDSPALGTFADTEITTSGYNNMKFVITGTLDRKVTADQNLVIQLLKLCKTRGWKAIYYNSTADNKEQQLIYMVSELTASGDLSTMLGGDYKYIMATIKDFKPIHTAKGSQMKFTLSGQITA